MKSLRKLRDYLTRDLWAIDLARFDPLTRAAFYVLRTLLLAVRGVLRDRVSVWASSLTYMTLIALLPFIALVMGLGAKLGVPMKLVDSFTGELPEATRTVLTRIATTFENADFRAVGLISIVLIAYAALRVLVRIEAAFNDIWGVKRGRNPLKKYLIFGAVVLLGPPLVFGALIATGALLASDFINDVTSYSATKATLEVIVPLIPWFAIWIALTLLYWLMPAARVRFVPAFAGAVVAGSVIQFAQRGVLLAQVGAYKQGWVFGSLAVIPILLVWVYFTWVVVMYGAELSYGIQHAGSYLFLYDDDEERATPAEIEETAIRVALYLADRYGEKNWAADDAKVAEAIGAPPRRVTRVLDGMADAKIAKQVRGDRFRLARAPNEITIAAVMRPFRGKSRPSVAVRDVPEGVHEVMNRLKEIVFEPLEITLEDALKITGDQNPA